MSNDDANEDNMTGMEMIEGYGLWHESIQVKNMLAFLRVQFPLASELDIRNHILHYTMVKLTVWMVPPADDGQKPKEPWET